MSKTEAIPEYIKDTISAYRDARYETDDYFVITFISALFTGIGTATGIAGVGLEKVSRKLTFPSIPNSLIRTASRAAVVGGGIVASIGTYYTTSFGKQFFESRSDLIYYADLLNSFNIEKKLEKGNNK